MKQMFPNIRTWSSYSSEKGMNFNGYFVKGPGGEGILIDPPPLSREDEHLMSEELITDIILTNRDHTREAAGIGKQTKARIWAPAADSGEMGTLSVDRWYNDREMLPGGVRVVSLSNQKSPGESALYIEASGGILILGDALIGKPAGKLSLLPSEKYGDIRLAKAGLRRLLDLSFEIVLVGDGEPLLTGGKRAVEAALAE